MTPVKLVNIIPTRLSDSALPTRTLPCGPQQCSGPSPSGITSVLHHSKLAQLLSLRASFPPDRSAHLPTSALCLVRGDWAGFSTQFTCGLPHQNQNQNLYYQPTNQVLRWSAFGCLQLGQWPMTYLMTLSDWTMSCQPWPPRARYGQWARYK